MPSSFLQHHPESQDDCVSDTGLDDMPINKVTSFHGKLNGFLHQSTSDNPSQEKPSTPSPSAKSTMASVKTRRSDYDPRNQNQSLQLSTTRSHTRTSRVTRSQSAQVLHSPTLPRSPIRRAKRPYTPADSPHESTCLLRDTIPAGLILLLVGVNPGLLTGSTGYAYAHPSNRFWHFLHSSGITTDRHPPSDTYKLPKLYGVGNTNIVARPTRDASMLSKAEMDEGVSILEEKIRSQKPEAVCLVGKSIWEAIWRVKYGTRLTKEDFQYGWQDPSENLGRSAKEKWKGAPVFVATTTSGLAAGMSMKEKEEVWAQLGAWVMKRREEREERGVEVGA